MRDAFDRAYGVEQATQAVVHQAETMLQAVFEAHRRVRALKARMAERALDRVDGAPL
jgi:hypothetical protein